MKQYPKVPRYDHPVIPENFYLEGMLWLTEKMDGSNFRFSLYEDRFADRYPEAVRAIGAVDGDLVFGTKRAIRGTSSEPLADFDGDLRRAVRHLDANLDRAAVRAAHDEYGPLTFFAENMVLHTIDYDYAERPPPPLLGFDVYASDADPRETVPADPYAECFEGFLPAAAVFGEEGLFSRIGLDTVSVVEQALPASEFTPEEYEVPLSTWSDDVAEGVIVRKDSEHRRTKLVTSEFDELNRKRWGGHASEIEGTERFVAAFCTNARIRKTVHRMIREEEYEFSRAIIEALYPRVVEDIWTEEWHTIMDLDFAFTPKEVYPLVAKRCVAVVEMMETNARLNDAEPEDLWRDVE